MGSGNSCLSEHRRKSTKFKRSLSSLICGSSSSRATHEIEDYPVDMLVNSAGYSRSVPNSSQSLHKESVLLRSSQGIEFTSPKSGRGCLSDTSTLSSEGRFLENSRNNVGTSSASRDVDNGFPESAIEGHDDVQTGIVDSSSVVSPDVCSSNIGSQSLEVDDSIRDPMPSDLGFLVSNRIQGSAEGNILQVDISSVSSANVSGRGNEMSTREARRNNRRMFWDAFSSRNSRRHADFSTILFATDDVENDNIGSRRSWRLVDFGSNIFSDGVSDDDLWHSGRRSHLSGERRSHSRSEFWGRLRGRSSERGGRIGCPSGLHPDGSCMCWMENEVRGQNSMSRIVMLAEALFEVLDDIHRQPASFGLSIFSNPAPESAVDSLPVKSYEKSTAVKSDDDVEQCYICLEEYEIGDNIRVLPCTHEYHMTCVDKWLKEIHGVCPLCRGDVRQGTTNGSLPNSDGSSMAADPV